MALAITKVVYWTSHKQVTSDYPSDRELVSLFHANRSTFERLCKMAIEDAGVVSYMSDKSSGENAVDKKRNSEYRHLLSEIHSKLVMRTNAFAVSFSYSEGGSILSVGSSWMKGIVYLPNGYMKVGEIVNNLDKRPSGDGTYLVPIEGNWYLVYSQSD